MEHLIYSPKALGEMIKRQRKLKQLNQAKAGSAFKLDQTTVSNIERGVNGTRIETIFRLLAALELEMVIRPKKNLCSKNKERW